MIRRLIRIAGALAVLGALAYIVWPTALGGAATFVVVRGHSMEPTYSQGDLLYARNDRAFTPDEPVVYRIPKGDPGEGSLVVHRMLRRLPDGTYLFQGDNKNAPDDATPPSRDLVATPMFNLGGWPTKGLVIAPIVFTLIVGIAVTVALWPAKEIAESADGEIEDEFGEDPSDDDSDSGRRRIRVDADERVPDSVRCSPHGDPRRPQTDQPPVPATATPRDRA